MRSSLTLESVGLLKESTVVKASSMHFAQRLVILEQQHVKHFCKHAQKNRNAWLL